MQPLRHQAEAARELARAAALSDGIAQPQRDLQGIFAAIRSGATDPPPADAAANTARLLASTGLDPDRAGRDLRATTFKKCVASEQCATNGRRHVQTTVKAPASGTPATSKAAPPQYLDVDAYMRSVINSAVAGALAEPLSVGAASHTTAHTLTAWQREEWERSKETLMSLMGFSLPVAAMRETLTSSSAAVGPQLDVPASFTAAATTALTAASMPHVSEEAAAFGLGKGDVGPRSAMHPYAAQFVAPVRDLSVITSVSNRTCAAERSHVCMEFATVAENNMESVDAALTALDVSQRTRWWQLIRSVTQEDVLPRAGYRYMAEEYGATARESGGSSVCAPTHAAELQWAAGSMTYMSSLFRHVLETTVASSPKYAPSGVATGVRPYIVGYLALLRDSYNMRTDVRGVPLEPEWYMTARNSGTLINDVPIWPQAFLALRCGARGEAISILNEGLAWIPPDSHGHKEMTHLLNALQAYCIVLDGVDMATGRGSGANGTVSVDVAVQQAVATCATDGLLEPIGKVAILFHREKDKKSEGLPFDPWLLSLSNLVAGAASDLECFDGSVLSRSKIQDVVWQRVWAVLTSALAVRGAPVVQRALQSAGLGSAASLKLAQPYTLTHAAGIIVDGMAVYDKDARKPYRYAEALMLVGEPEAAVAYLATHGRAGSTPENPTRHVVDAVHLALALNFYGLLRTWNSDAATRSDFAASLRASSEASKASQFGEELYTVVVGPGTRVHALDLAALLRLYTSMIVGFNPGVVCDYVALLPDAVQRRQLLAESLAESAAFAELAGPLDTTAGALRPAAMAGHLALHGRPVGTSVVAEEEVTEIIYEAARRLSESDDKALDAVQLFVRIPHVGLKPALMLLCAVLQPLVDEPLRGPTDGGDAPSLRFRVASIAAAVQSLPVPPMAGQTGTAALLQTEEIEAYQRGLHALLLLCEFVDMVASLPGASGSGVGVAVGVDTPATRASGAAMRNMRARTWAQLDDASREVAQQALSVLDMSGAVPRSPATGNAGWVAEVRPAIVAVLPAVFFLLRSLFEDAKMRAGGLARTDTNVPGRAATLRDVEYARGIAVEYQQRAAALVTGHTDQMRRYISSQTLANLQMLEAQMR